MTTLLALTTFAAICLTVQSCAPKRIAITRGPYTGDYRIECSQGGKTAIGYGPDKKQAERECWERRRIQ